MPLLTANSYRVTLPFCLGENYIDNDVDIKPGFARTVLNYSIGYDGRLELRGGRAKISARVAGKRFISRFFYVSTANPPVYKEFWGTSTGEIYERNRTTGAMTLQTLPNALTGGKIWRDIMFNGKLLICDGTNLELQYDGTSWSTLTTPARFRDWTVHKNRIWAVAGVTLYWCTLNDETNWTAGALSTSANSRLLSTIFRIGDEIMSVAGIGDFIIVFGRRNFAVYQTDYDQTLVVIFKDVGGVGIVATRAHVSANTLIFWSYTGWREISEALTGETVNLDSDSPLRKNEPYLRDLISFIDRNSLGDNISVALQSDKGRILTLVPKDETDLSKMEFNNYSYGKNATGWFRWSRYPVFCVGVDPETGNIFAGGDEYIYQLDVKDADDDGGNIGGTGGAIWEPPYYFFQAPEIEKTFDTMELIVENKRAVNLSFEPQLDLGTSQSVKCEVFTIPIAAGGSYYDEDTEAEAVYYDDGAFYDGAGTGRGKVIVPISGIGFAYKPFFRYIGSIFHRFMYMSVKGRRVV